jgi:hypothetical protein
MTVKEIEAGAGNCPGLVTNKVGQGARPVDCRRRVEIRRMQVTGNAKRPWRKNLRQIPTSIGVKLTNLGTVPIIVAATKQITDEEIRSGLYDHLAINLSTNGIEFQSRVIPPPDSGRFSKRNVEGWEIVRSDLPMITKTFYSETPNFGDWSRGSHTTSRDRQVYQREFREPRDIPILIELLRTSEGHHSAHLMKFAVEWVLEQSDADFEDDLVFCLNLLQENVGRTDIYPSDSTREDFIKTLTLEWEVFPPGTIEEVVGRLRRRMRRSDTRTDTILKDRVEAFSELKPRAYVQGTNGFNSYIGAQFADDLVVFENVRYGNALYILYDDWQSVSRRSRVDLIRGTDADFDRIIHGAAWKQQFQDVIKYDLRKRARR